MQRGGLGNPTLAQLHAPSAALMTQQGVSQEYQNEYARVMSQVQSGNRGAAPALPVAPPAPAATGLAGLFGALAGAAAAPRAAPAAASAVAAVPQPQGMGAQAKARKEHLTGLFLSKGCRMADVQN
jgi:hypothetical protein